MTTPSEAGYRKPPPANRFSKGQSGNPKGRPRGQHNRPPYDAVLGQIVTVRENGVERRLTAAEAFLLHVTKRGLEGDSAAARAAMAAIEEARSVRTVHGHDSPRRIVRVLVEPGSVNSALEPLRMATKLDRYRPAAKMMLEPWLVEAALARLGDRRLSVEEQATVVAAVRTPHKVRWPEWWTVAT